MDEPHDALHAAIADHLRRRRRPPLRGMRGFICLACGRRVVEGDPALGLPFGALWEAMCCPQCHREPLSREEAAARAIRRERGDVPRCRICGTPVDDDEGGLYNLDDMRAVRECRDHYVSF